MTPEEFRYFIEKYTGRDDYYSGLLRYWIGFWEVTMLETGGPVSLFHSRLGDLEVVMNPKLQQDRIRTLFKENGYTDDYR